MNLLLETRLNPVWSRLMSDEDYPRALVEAALRQSLRAQQWVLDACAELGFEQVHVQPPRQRDELGSARNPHTVWAMKGPSKLLASYYLAVTSTGVALVVVEGPRADGRLWTLPEFGPAYHTVVQAAHKSSS